MIKIIFKHIQTYSSRLFISSVCDTCQLRVQKIRVAVLGIATVGQVPNKIPHNVDADALAELSKGDHVYSGLQ